MKRLLMKLSQSVAILACALALVSMSVGNAAASSRLIDGKFGKAINLHQGERSVTVPLGRTMEKLPVTFELWAKADASSTFNILLACSSKSNMQHWELYTQPSTGILCLYMPQLKSHDSASRVNIADGAWHFIALRFTDSQLQLYVDGKLGVDLTSPSPLQFDTADLHIGTLDDAALAYSGAVDELLITRAAADLSGFVPSAPFAADESTVRLYHFDQTSGDSTPDSATGPDSARALIVDGQTLPVGNAFLDEVQDQQFEASALSGDTAVDLESKLPALSVTAQPLTAKWSTAEAQTMSLSGPWLMKSCPHVEFPAPHAYTASESIGVEQGWEKPGYDRKDWLPVRVPTSVQSALIAQKQLDDPFWYSNTYDELTNYGEPKEFPWVRRFTRNEQQDWWFARSFNAPESWKGKSIRLTFDGIDYSGSVYLNGSSLGYHAGMFGGPVRDVSGLLHFDSPNWLVVRVDRAPPIWTGILKGSPGFGWHYGHLVSMGIWRDVHIDALPKVEISDPYVVTQSISGSKAVLKIEYYVDSHEPGIIPLQVSGQLDGANFSAAPIAFANKLNAPYGRSRYRTIVSLNNAHIWWPLNYGAQNLYNLRLSCRSAADVISTTVARFGIRTLEMKPVAGTLSKQSYRWQFVVNGQPMFIKGANWCWSDPMLKVDPAKYERLLELARRAGIQMFRAWGGGIIETDEFYRRCDEKGLMVYQEFPFCWGPWDFPRTDPVVEDQQVSQVVKHLRNHPSLVMYGGGNENSPSPGNDEALFLVGKRCREFDPSRPFHRTDPWGGSTHNWSVYHGRRPIDSCYHGQPSVWYGEFGMATMTNMSSTSKYWPQSVIDEWPPSFTDGGVLGHLNTFTITDIFKVLGYADYGPIDSIRYAGEGQRSCSGQNKTGFWFYKFTDLFPGHSFAVVDYYGSPKISYYRAKQFCRPICAFASYDKLDWADNEPFAASIHVADDTNHPVASAQVVATIYGSNLKPVWEKDYSVRDLQPNARVDLDSINVPIPPGQNKPFLLAVTLRSSAGELISDEWYWLNFQAKSDAMSHYWTDDVNKIPVSEYGQVFQAYANAPEARLLTLPKTNLSANCSVSGTHGQIKIVNNSDNPAFNVLIDNFPDGARDFLDEDSFCLRPHETRQIGFDIGPGETAPALSVRAWNAPSVSVGN